MMLIVNGMISLKNNFKGKGQLIFIRGLLIYKYRGLSKSLESTMRSLVGV